VLDSSPADILTTFIQLGFVIPECFQYYDTHSHKTRSIFCIITPFNGVMVIQTNQTKGTVVTNSRCSSSRALAICFPNHQDGALSAETNHDTKSLNGVYVS
jgi:hypothetical protein